MKPGIQTSEFWLTCGTQITALIVALAAPDTTEKIMAGATALGAVVVYLYHRYALKSQHAEMVQIVSPAKPDDRVIPPGIPPGIPCLIAVLLLLFAAPVQAQHPSSHWSFRLNVQIAPRPVYAPPVYIPPVVVVPQPVYQAVVIDPGRPLPYPTLPVYQTPAGIYYQVVRVQ